MNVKLRIVQGRPQGKSMLFPHGEYVFGRGTECHVRPNSDWVSRQHCLLRITADGAFLRDLGSRNGTLINGSRFVEEQRLEHGDQVQVGPLVFEVMLEETADPPTTIEKGPGTPARPAPDTFNALKTVDTAEMQAMREGSPPTREETGGQSGTAAELPTMVPARGR
ncbi:MAG TPA: FHA domain-containing protein [Gemmataceae bacterium]|nr:FHA domain-containing protein [Gemmataceae bacterium]